MTIRDQAEALFRDGPHRHEFSVDTSCDCGVMLSAYTRRLTRENAEMAVLLSRVIDDADQSRKGQDWTYRLLSADLVGEARALLARLETS